MNPNDPIAALEIGTSNTTLAIGEREGDRCVRITALSSIPSTGVRKSQIIAISQAAHSVASVLKHIERDFKYKYAIGQACLAVSGAHIRSKRLDTQWQLLGKTVEDDDLREIYNRSLETGLDPDERILLDEAEIGYGIDGHDTPEPKGMAGHVLLRRSLCIHGDAKRVADAKSAAQHAKLEISDVYFAGSCAANAVLKSSDRAAGVLTIDLGGGSTTYTVHENGRMIHAGVVGVGGDHVSNDVRSAFSITHAQAEELKKNVSAQVGAGGSARIAINSTTPGFDPVTISRRAAETVINARLQELFAVILDQLDRENLSHRFNSGVILTGGMAATPGIAALAEHVLGRRTRIGTFNGEIIPYEGGPEPYTYATTAGLILAAFHAQSPRETANPFKRFFGGFFG